jgi:peptidoglycan L-alanyl-D-glutamate endopeptidase CwlK
MSYELSKMSQQKLAMAHPDLVRVVQLAITVSTQDFRVGETMRTLARQRQLVAAGASQTLRSRHLPSKGGLCRAADLEALVGGKYRADWSLYYKIAEAMKDASLKLGIPVEWGGTWKLLSDTPNPITANVLSRGFPDGFHFQLPWAQYP